MHESPSKLAAMSCIVEYAGDTATTSHLCPSWALRRVDEFGAAIWSKRLAAREHALRLDVYGTRRNDAVCSHDVVFDRE